MKSLLCNLAVSAGALLVSLLLLSLALSACGYPALIILSQWAKGAAGSPADLLISLKNASPLILTGLSAGVAFRSGVFNIGAEGQSIAGSIAAIFLATRLAPWLPPPLALPGILLFAALGGAAWAAISAALSRYRSVPVVLSTILLNFIALQLLAILLEGPLKTSATQVIQSDALPAAYTLPVLLSSHGASLHAGFLVALVAAAACWLLQSRTAFGFELKVTGLNPTAALYAGIPVASRQFAILLISGALAGLSGTTQLMGVEGAHYLNPSPPSYGYSGIAIALLGRLHPLGIVAAAIFFAMLDSGATNLEFFHLPLEVSDIVKALLLLTVLATSAYLARRQTHTTKTSS